MRTAILTAAVVLIGAAACTESGRARNDATFSDKPADITCWSYGTVTYEGRSTGKVSNREGRVSFVDAASGRYTVVDGECRLVYDKG